MLTSYLHPYYPHQTLVYDVEQAYVFNENSIHQNLKYSLTELDFSNKFIKHSCHEDEHTSTRLN